MSRRDDITAALDTRLKTIKKAGGYHTDAGDHIYSWLGYKFAEVGSNPNLSWRDINRVIDFDGTYTPALGEQVHKLLIEIDGETPCDTIGTELDQLVEDIRQAVAVDPLWGGLAADTDDWEDDKFIDESGDTLIGYCKVAFTIVYLLPEWTD